MRSKESDSFRPVIAPHLYPPSSDKCQHSLSSFAPLVSVSQFSFCTLSPSLTNPHENTSVSLKYHPTPLATCRELALLPVSKMTSLRSPWASRARVELPVGLQDSINRSPGQILNTVSASSSLI